MTTVNNLLIQNGLDPKQADFKDIVNVLDKSEYKLVPVEPTDEMVKLVMLEVKRHYDLGLSLRGDIPCTELCKAMLSASPKIEIGQGLIIQSIQADTVTIDRAEYEAMKAEIVRYKDLLRQLENVTMEQDNKLLDVVNNTKRYWVKREDGESSLVLDAFDEWHDNTYGIRPSFKRDHEGSSHWDRNKQDKWEAWQVNQAHNDAVIAELLEALEEIKTQTYQPKALIVLHAMNRINEIASTVLTKHKKGL